MLVWQIIFQKSLLAGYMQFTLSHSWNILPVGGSADLVKQNSNSFFYFWGGGGGQRKYLFIRAL